MEDKKTRGELKKDRSFCPIFFRVSNFKKISRFLILAFLLVFISSSRAEGPNIKEGLWEITVNMEIPGINMPMIPYQTYTHCINKKNMIPRKEEPKQSDCNTVKTEVNGDTVSWVMECKTNEEGVITSNGYITYKGSTFEGVVKVKHSGMDMTQHLKGKWLGPCN